MINFNVNTIRTVDVNEPIGTIKKQSNGLVDMEDLGKVINVMKTKRGKTNGDAQPWEILSVGFEAMSNLLNN